MFGGCPAYSADDKKCLADDKKCLSDNKKCSADDKKYLADDLHICRTTKNMHRTLNIL